MENKMYMSIRETARYTGLAESFLRAAVRENKVPGIRSGKKFCVNVPQLLLILEEECKQNGGVGA